MNKITHKNARSIALSLACVSLLGSIVGLTSFGINAINTSSYPAVYTPFENTYKATGAAITTNTDNMLYTSSKSTSIQSVNGLSKYTKTTGIGHNSITSSQLDTKYYLPGSRNHYLDMYTTGTGIFTAIYISNPISSKPQSVLVTLYNADGSIKNIEGDKAVYRVETSDTITVLTSELGIESSSYYGTVTVEVTGNPNPEPIVVMYDVIEYQQEVGNDTLISDSSAWGMEGIPASLGSRFNFVTPVVTATWGIQNQVINITNTGNLATSVYYSFCIVDDVCTGASTSMLNPNGTYELIVGGSHFRNQVQALTGSGDAVGYVKLFTPSPNGTIVSTTEDFSFAGSNGAKGNYSRGRNNFTEFSSKMCLLGITDESFGIEKTGISITNASPAEEGRPADIEVTFYSNDGKQLLSFTDSIPVNGSLNRDTDYIQLPSGFYGAAEVEIASEVHSASLIAGTQDIAESHTSPSNSSEYMGRGLKAVSCSEAALLEIQSDTSYVTGILDSVNTAVVIYNPGSSQITASVTTMRPNDAQQTQFLFIPAKGSQTIVFQKAENPTDEAMTVSVKGVTTALNMPAPVIVYSLSAGM